jgi:uncharacterized delta-60 repeat protein
MHKLYKLALLSLLLVSACPLVRAQDGTHDLSFNGIGYTTYPGFSNASQFNDLALQPDGKIIAAGSYLFGGSGKAFPVVFRFNSDGTVDNSWNGTGYILDTVGDRGMNVYAVGIQSTGRVIVAGPGQDCGSGTCAYVFSTAAYHPDGTPDSTFGGESQVRVYPGGNASGILDMHVYPDDRVLTVGYFYAGSSWQFQLVRMLPDGELDTTFGTGGIAFFDAGAGAEQLNKVIVDPDGKIVVAGYSQAAGDEDAIIARLLPDGSPDLSFGGGDGFTTITLTSTPERFEGLCRMQNGKYFAVGSSTTSGGSANRLYARFLPDGTLDATYSTDGYDAAHLLSLPYSSTTAKTVLALPDNKVAIAGWYLGDVMYDGYVQRLDSNGVPDITFGDGGLDTLDVYGGYYNHFYSMVQQPDGKLLCAGGAQIPFTFTTLYHLARYNMDDVIAFLEPTSLEVLQLLSFPNPSKGLVTLSADETMLGWQITDLRGRTMQEGLCEAKEVTLDLQQLPDAVYAVSVRLASGKSATARLILRR